MKLFTEKYKLNAYNSGKKTKHTQTLYISLELNFRVKKYAWTKVKFCEWHDFSWPQQKLLGQGLPDLVYPKEDHLEGSWLV